MAFQGSLVAVQLGSWGSPEAGREPQFLLLPRTQGPLLAVAAAGVRWLAEPAPADRLGPLRRLGRLARREEEKRAAAANVAAIQENDRFVSPDTPGRQDNDR